MEINDTYATTATSAPAPSCGCSSKAVLSEEIPKERETKLQFSVVIPTTKHVDTLVKVRDFMIANGLEMSSFESYRY